MALRPHARLDDRTADRIAAARDGLREAPTVAGTSHCILHAGPYIRRRFEPACLELGTLAPRLHAGLNPRPAYPAPTLRDRSLECRRERGLGTEKHQHREER
jgi:hypothetical protein